MSSPNPPPEILSLCPGCGATPKSFPCPLCQTPEATNVSLDPALSGHTDAILALVAAAGVVAAAFVIPWVVDDTPAWIAAGFLGILGLAMGGLAGGSIFLWPTSAWVTSSESAKGTFALQRGKIVHAFGHRLEKRSPDDVNAFANVTDRDAVAAAERLVHVAENIDYAASTIAALAQAARGEVTLEVVFRVDWEWEGRPGKDTGTSIHDVLVNGSPLVVTPLDETGDPSNADVVAAWFQDHTEWMDFIEPS